jgi:replicative DNA helicase
MNDFNTQSTLADKGFELATELDIVRLLIKSSVFAATYTEHLTSNLFRDQLKPLVDAASSYWKQYGKLPSNEALVQELKWKIGSNFTKEKAESIIGVLTSIKDDPSDPEYVEDKVQSFIKFKKVSNALHKAADIVTDATKKKDSKLLDEIANVVGTALEPVSIIAPSWFVADLETRTEYRASEANGDFDNIAFIPTGIPPLDKIYGKGGLQYGEIGIVIAPTGRGKSVMLEQTSNACAAIGKNAIYFSLELSEKLLLDRIDSMVSEVELSYIIQERNEVRARIIEKWQNSASQWGEVMFRELSSLGTSAFTLRNEIMRAKRLYNFIPELIVVDYVDLLTPSEKSRDQDWKNQQTCVKELRDLGKEMRCAVWTASQANRIGRNKQEEGVMITDGDSAESYSKNSVADLIVTLNQKKAYFELPDNEPKPMMLHIPKNRNGISNHSIGILTDFKRMAFYVGDFSEKEQLEKDALASGAFSDKDDKKGKKKIHG